ncbi:hypothetical protein [Leptospira bouyouniensis]|uniref:hypothetical protein n=1 Tax=Leptospira bouyouniensis TaxID=2484911 RepID=UPI001FD3EDAE|nr:hypothetical protein [Leptospira bouyouniensis]
MKNQSFQKFIFLTILLFMFTHCVGDLYFDTKNELDSSKVTRDEAVRKFSATLILKRSICPEASDFLLLSAGYFTTRRAIGCTGSKTTEKSQKTLQSCASLSDYVEKKALDVCLGEVLFFPCEQFDRNKPTIFQLNFPVCRGLFGPGGSSGNSI